MLENKTDKRPTIDIKSDLYEKLRMEAEEKLFDIKDYVEVILDRHMKRNKMISKMWPGLQIARVDKKTIVVINNIERKFFDVKLHDNFLHCEQDKSKSCDHTAFVWMQVEDLDLESRN
jgi:hypothetical protein